MDYSNELKFRLEKNDILDVVEEFKLDKETIFESLQTNPNILCSNDSFLFIYFEKSACFLALSLNHLCKNKDAPFKQSFQLLQLNEAPVGQLKKCLINQTGTYILLIYEKSVFCVELPLKWGKFEQFDGGRSNIMCKTIKFNPNKNSSILDAIWHTKLDENLIVCLGADCRVKIYRLSNPSNPVKEFYFSNSLEKDPSVKGPDFLCLDMGTKFEYNEKIAYPIFVQRADSVIECLIDYGLHNFEYIGPLSVKPYHDEIEQAKIQSFLCLPGHPNCLVFYLSNGMIYHAVLITNTKNLNFELVTSFNEDDEIEEDAVLVVYETFNFSENIENVQTIKIFKDPSINSRYFIKHANGLHSVHLKWLRELEYAFQNENLTDFNEKNLCELNNLISTNPLFQQQSHNFLLGLTVIYDFGKTRRSLVCLDNQAKFICKNIEFLSEEENDESENKFSSYVVDLLKRDSNMPLILTNLQCELPEAELKMVSQKIVNLIRNEYIERQKKVVLEFQKRNKILKSREKLQNESINDINNKINKLKENKDNLNHLHQTIAQKQKILENRMENVFKRLFTENRIPINDREKKVYFELKTMHDNLKETQENVLNKTANLNQIKEKPQSISYDEQELLQIKKMLKNESEKINELIRKIEILKSTVG
ncbi:Nuclear pore complex [Brachionus plicatilis]|uniref:Nuclear pore complex n=1 Tax=Brachionus plicatilis TaxID=10195 RepID=A0A3M7PU31_BRAPC|nr:Nuclear pore complex [Brachionus plicatilis]